MDESIQLLRSSITMDGLDIPLVVVSLVVYYLICARVPPAPTTKHRAPHQDPSSTTEHSTELRAAQPQHSTDPRAAHAPATNDVSVGYHISCNIKSKHIVFVHKKCLVGVSISWFISCDIFFFGVNDRVTTRNYWMFRSWWIRAVGR